MSPEELMLISDVKLDLGGTVLKALNEVRMHVTRQRAAQAKAMHFGETDDERFAAEKAARVEIKRIDDAQPERWIAIANTHFQQGLMALVRAVAQPEGF